MFKKLLCAITLIFAMIFALASCSEIVRIENFSINENGELVLLYTDGTEQNLGTVKGEKGDSPSIEINEDGYWVINGENTNVLAKGEKGDTGDVGPQGPQGENNNSEGTSFPKNSISISCDGYIIVDGKKTDISLQGFEIHTYREWTITKTPTSGADGERSRVCSDCGNTETEKIHYLNADGNCVNCNSVKAALICLHGTSSTYDKNFIEAFKTACQNKGLKEENYTIITDIPESPECYDEAANFADEGYDVIFADSYGHEAYMLQAAKEYPTVQFCHATGTMAHTENIGNFQNAYAAIHEGQYLTGVAAGLKLLELYGEDITDEEAKVGYVASWPYAEVISCYTAWFLGVRSVVPKATMEVRYTYSWYDEPTEMATAEALIDAGCKLLSQSTYSTGVPTACENEGIPNVAYNGETGKTNTFVIASKINWVPYFEYMLDCVIAGEDIDTDWVGTLANDSVQITVLGDAAAEGTQAKLDEVAAQLKSGTLKVFDCSTFTVKNAKADDSNLSNADNITMDENGKLIAYYADVDYDNNWTSDTQVVKTEGGITYFAECEFRSAPYFNIIIDGITICDLW